MKKTCLHCTVYGLVQGVWYRASTKEQADGLNLTGWVRNLPDGCVETVICGNGEQVTAMLNWLRDGPPQARVTQVEHHEIPCEPFTEFEVR